MTTAILLFIISGLIIVVLFLATVAGMFYYRNLRQEKQIEHLRLKSLNQAIQIELMTEKRQKFIQEIIDHMLEDYDHEYLIAMNT